MKLLTAFKEQILTLGELRYAWFTSFNINIEFIETYLLPAVLDMDLAKTRQDYEYYQSILTEKGIDFRVFCDKRFMEADRNKRTAIPVHGISPALWEDGFSKDSLFHPKVIYLEDKLGNRILGTGSANLTLSGWGRNQEVFSFHRIETKDQYDAAKLFFDKIASNVGLTEGLPARRGLPRDQGNWAFVHSFQDSSFIERLFENATAKDLLVWSPYLSSDIAGFFTRLKANVDVDQLNIHLVPDRVQGQFIRTPWTDDLQTLVDDGSLTFYENPTLRHDNVELCHAKVWKLGRKLAVGSWNFTAKGANLLDDAGEWDRSVNIEAGVIVTNSSDWSSAVGAPIQMRASNFANDELLKEEALEVPEQLPFDIHVEFDWRNQCYTFTGEWHEGIPQEGFLLKVPGHNAAIPLLWRPQLRSLSVKPLIISDPIDVLNERRFQVERNGQKVHCSLITETGLAYRRAQGFESLGDLLNAFIFGGEPSDGDHIALRAKVKVNDEDKMTPDQDSEALTLNVLQSEAAISYFRLFQATHQFDQNLKAIKSVSQLNSCVFTRPGCLLELVEKSRAIIKDSESTLFHWFLTQEVQTLCAVALKQRKALGKTDDSLPASRWAELQLKSPSLQAGIELHYIKMIQKECGYVGA